MDTAITVVVAILGSGALNTIVTYLITKRKEKDSDSVQTKTAIRLVMKDRIKFLCEQYMKQGWIYEDELDDLIIMHQSYHDDLGGNGFLDHLMQQSMKLEIKVR